MTNSSSKSANETVYDSASDAQSAAPTASMSQQQQPPARQREVAVVGIACRFPGGANTPDEFWKLLIDMRDASSEVPPDRFNIDRYYSKDKTKSGAIISRKAFFINVKLDEFDAAYFGISGREAAAMDPHHKYEWMGREFY